MKNLRSIVVFTILVLLSTNIAKAQKDLKPEVPIEKVDELFKNWDSTEKPGIAVGIVSNGAIVHTKGYGHADLTFDIPITAETRFYVGELSNQFTALALLILESENKLSLKDPIRKYLPELPDIVKPITVGDLVNHTSGLRDLDASKAFLGKNENNDFTSDQAIQLFAIQQTLNYEPGQEQQVNTSAFILLERIVSKASGTSYTDFIQQNIFDPLQMENTFFDADSGANIKNKARGYYPQEDGFIERDLNQMELNNTNVFSTVGDMSRWLKNLYHPKVGNAQLIKKLLAPTVLNGVPVEEENLSVYFNQLRYWDYNGTKKLYQVSVGGGYACKVVHFPDQHMSAVVLGNGGTYNGGMATMTGELYISNYFKKTPSSELAKVKGIDLNAEALQDYTGDYWEADALYSRSINLKNDTLFYSRGYNESPIIPIGNNKFQMITYGKVYITFEKRNNNNVMLVEVEGQGTYEHLRYEKDAEWTNDLEEYTGNYYCQELKTSYHLSIKNNQLVINNLRDGDISLSPILKDSFVGNRRFFDQLTFTRNSKMNIKGLEIMTSNGDKFWFDATPKKMVVN